MDRSGATYTERWHDYVFNVRPATYAEVKSWKDTATQMGWEIPSRQILSDATVGWFSLPDNDDAMALPYELRSTVMRPNGNVREILAVHYHDLIERVTRDIHAAWWTLELSDDERDVILAEWEKQPTNLMVADERGFYRDWSL